MLLRQTVRTLRLTLSQPVISLKSETDPKKFSEYAQLYSSHVDSVVAFNDAFWTDSSEHKRQKVAKALDALSLMTEDEKAYLKYLMLRDSLEAELNGGMRQAVESDWKLGMFKGLPNCFDQMHKEMTISTFLSSGAGSGQSGGGSSANEDAGEAAAEEAPVEVKAQTKFTVNLVEVPAAKKLVTIKEVKAMLGVGLKDAKDLVEGLPAEIKKDIDMEEVEKLKEKFAALGCGVEVV